MILNRRSFTYIETLIQMIEDKGLELDHLSFDTVDKKPVRVAFKWVDGKKTYYRIDEDGHLKLEAEYRLHTRD